MTDTKPIKPPNFGEKILDPDFVDRVWLYMLQSFPQLAGTPPEKIDDVKQHIRRSERGERPYISPASASAREREAARIMELFNGRNATEVARIVKCSRAKVYRVLKQAGNV